MVLYRFSTMIVFRCFVTPVTYVWTIQTTNDIQSDKDNKLNHDHQYVAELKSYIF